MNAADQEVLEWLGIQVLPPTSEDESTWSSVTRLGTVADLDVAIRATGDSPERFADPYRSKETQKQWRVIRHLLRERFGHLEIRELWERCTDWLSAEFGLEQAAYLGLKLADFRDLLVRLTATGPTGNSSLPEPSPIVPQTGGFESRNATTSPAPKKKRSTSPGDARAKLIAALTHHHRYQNGAYLNLDPIGNNELADSANVSKSTASVFIRREFESRRGYQVACRDDSVLNRHLRRLNDDTPRKRTNSFEPPTKR